MARTERGYRALQRTSVPPEKRKGEIEKMLKRRDAKGIRMTVTDHPRDPDREIFILEFVWGDKGLAVRKTVSYSTKTAQHERTALGVLYEMLRRRLDGIDAGIEEFEHAFAVYMISDQGVTIAEAPERFRDAMPGGFTFSDGQLSSPHLALASGELNASGSKGDTEEAEWREVD